MTLRFVGGSSIFVFCFDSNLPLMMKLLVKNIGQLVTVVEGKEVCLAGKGMSQIKVVLVIVQMLRNELRARVGIGSLY